MKISEVEEMRKELAERFVKARLVRPKNTYFTHSAGSYVNSEKHSTLEEAIEAQKIRPHQRITMITWRGEYVTIKKGCSET